MPHQNLHPRITRDRCWLAPQNLQPRITRDLAFSARIPRITRAASCPPPALVSKPPQGGWAEEYSQPVGAKYGPGHCNKYVALNATPCFVRYQPDEIAIVGRDLWRMPGNPYQFDHDFQKRMDAWREKAIEKLEHERLTKVSRRMNSTIDDSSTRASTSSTRSTTSHTTSSSGEISARSCPPRPLSMRRSQSYEARCETIPCNDVSRKIRRDIPGYEAHVPGYIAENVMGKSWGRCARRADHIRRIRGTWNDGVHGWFPIPEQYPADHGKHDVF